MNKRERVRLEKKVAILREMSVSGQCGVCATLAPLDSAHCHLHAFVLAEYATLYSGFFINACNNYSEGCPNQEITAIVAEISELVGKDN